MLAIKYANKEPCFACLPRYFRYSLPNYSKAT